MTDQSIAGLHGMQLGERKLVVQRATTGGKDKEGRMDRNNPVQVQVPGINRDVMNKVDQSEVLCLLNMVTHWFDGGLGDENFEFDNPQIQNSLQNPSPMTNFVTTKNTKTSSKISETNATGTVVSTP